MAVTNGWGQGVLNNLIEWGKGGVNNTISWGDIYADSYSGDTALTAADNLLLDQYSGAAAAYSVRKLSSSYSGSALRVRRSSDNAEQDIGFSDNNLDTSALTTFVGANNGFVVTWYDQSGNGNDATNATAAEQPQIVSSGSLLTENSKPCLRPQSGATDLLTTLAGNANRNLFTVIRRNGIVGDRYTLYQDDASASNYVGFADSGSTAAFAANATINEVRINGAVESVPNRGVFYTLTTNQVLTYIDLDDSAFSAVEIGYGGSAAFGMFQMQEFVVYNSDQTSNRTEIESNINTYYSIY